MRLSVLDQVPITKGSEPETSLKNAEKIALAVEEWGYHRMWLAEHHSADIIGSSAPEIIAAYLLSKTSKLRVGTGGIMMMHYSPLKLAEITKTLCALAPNRFDFGVGRAPGGDNHVIYAMSEGRKPNVIEFSEKLETTLKLINDEMPTSDLYRNITATPANISLPEAWLLGSSGASAVSAGKLGMGYSYAQFFKGEINSKSLDVYKQNFTPSEFMEKPKVIVSYMATVADTADEAEYEARPHDISGLMSRKGQLPQVLTPEEAFNYPLTEMDRMDILENRKAHLVGTGKEVSKRLLDEQSKYGFDEVMICCIAHSLEKRLNTYRHLAEQF
ncbi:LLM class flavin-dependent oxidoreductase [[Bacillus] enclensis]|uniref:LLM class flavin-dependent oxidoreductase n=1 Tax=[Bacillus] enclensis TaxID=1402860 RepID=UPI0018DB4EBC|nr:LLM class flavin-dependent oxidoreductase [[Bacillus] enclensis]MBH9968169.1 LLM class flavin-dependent oxidoreductase [[Bacillus] enclensis]